MTVKDIQSILHNIYSNTGECNKPQVINGSKCKDIQSDHNKENCVGKISTSKCKIRKNSNIRHTKIKDNRASEDNSDRNSSHSTRNIFCPSPFISTAKSNFSFSLKQTFCNIFRSRKSTSTDSDPGINSTDTVVLLDVTKEASFEKRALPPVPDDGPKNTYERESSMDFATSIEKVKDVSFINNNKIINYIKLIFFIEIFSMDGIGVLYQAKLLKKYCQMNLMVHLLFVTVVMTIIFFH